MLKRFERELDRLIVTYPLESMIVGSGVAAVLAYWLAWVTY